MKNNSPIWLLVFAMAMGVALLPQNAFSDCSIVRFSSNPTGYWRWPNGMCFQKTIWAAPVELPNFVASVDAALLPWDQASNAYSLTGNCTNALNLNINCFVEIWAGPPEHAAQTITMDLNGDGYIDDGYVEVNFWTKGKFPVSKWTSECLSTKLDLTTVLIHEIGHWLGFGHAPYSCRENTVIYTNPQPGECVLQLRSLDLAAVSLVYPPCSESDIVNSGFFLGEFLATGCSYNQAASVVGPAVDESGAIRWIVTREQGTAGYELELRSSGRAVGKVLEKPGLGMHEVVSARPFDEVVLFEREVSGGRNELARVTKAGPQASVKETDGLDSSASEVPERQVINGNARASRATGPLSVIFAGTDYVASATSEVAAYWTAQYPGENIVVYNAGAWSILVRAYTIRQKIKEHAEQHGTIYFHLIGDSDDGMNSPLWESSDYWKEMRENLWKVGYSDGKLDDANTIPTFYTPRTDRIRGGLLALTPFMTTDQEWRGGSRRSTTLLTVGFPKD